MQTRRFVMVSAAAACIALPARAQFGDLFNAAQRKAADAAEKAASDALKSKPAEAPKSPPKAAEAAPAATEQPQPAASSSSASAPTAYGNRYDFVPGDKVLVYDDFSDTDVGEYPAKWTIKGGGGNQVEVVEIGSRRFMKSRYQKESQDSATQWLRYEIKGDMPKKFTIEFDADLAGPFTVLFSKPRGFGGQEIVFRPHEDNSVHSENAVGQLPVKKGVHHVAIAVSGTQAKLYVEGERVLTDPDAIVRPITRLGIEFIGPYKEEGDHQMFTAYRLAEGGKDAKTMLAGEGKIITHGILFDTGSDVIKPESGPTLRSILAILVEDPGLRFSIEGHTDNQGSDKVNGPLSEKRAAAVKVWLVSQGVEDKRLTAKGFGASKPIDSNDTAEGRANNRRVEFVKVPGTS